MKKKEYIKEIIRSFHINALPHIKPRELSVPTTSGKIVTLCGVRRCGKTYILYQTISELLASGVDKKRVVYINFEDERLDLSSDELDLVLQAYRELYELDLGDCFLFFDEIQNISGWEQFVRRIYDTLTKNIFITGSNAKLLSAEIATSLRGRNISYEVYPLSFSEYLLFLDFSPDIYNPNDKAKLKNIFLEFMKNGGFPETLGMSADIRANTLQGYFDVMIYRDIIERYEEKNSALLKYFIKRVLSTFTKAISINKIYNELKSSGYKVGKNTLYQYFDYIETIYLGFTLRRYDPSMLKSELSEKKSYLIDNGLLLSVSFAFSDDYGKLLENTVFLELKRSGKDIFYYEDKKECDFLVFDRDKAIEAIQVCYDMSDKDTREREIAGLLEACKALGLGSGVIVTLDEDDELTIDDVRIKLISVYKYLYSF
jgi:hypothetical protein